MGYSAALRKNRLFPLIGLLAQELGVSAYVVGGYVRDLMLGRPSTDVDIVCVGSGIELAQAFAKSQEISEVALFKNFGTAMVRWNGCQIEFVGSRKESYQLQSRKPMVSPGTLEEDLLRRDFTINTLALSLCPSDFGALIDKCGGSMDLKEGIIRTPKEPLQTFSDDPLRILRAVRFATQFGYKIAPATGAAMKETASRLAILSKERVATELNKIMGTTYPDQGFYLLDEYGVLPYLLPEVVALKGVEKRGRHSHKDNFVHTLQVLRNVAEKSSYLWLRWAALLHDVAKPPTKQFDPRVGFTFHGHESLGANMAGAIFKRLGLPLRQELRYVKKLIRLHLRHLPLVEERVTDAAIRRYIYDAGEILEDLLTLCRADITSNNERKVRHYLANFDKLACKMLQVEQKDYVRNLQPVIGGEAIMEVFGLKPCPQVGLIKNALKEAVLEGSVPNEEGALYTYMLDKAASLGLKPAASVSANS